MPFIVLGLSHRSSPVAVRERFAFSDAALPQALEKLRRDAAAAEAVILSTCNRVEIYAVMEPPEREAAALLRQFLIDCRPGPELSNDEIYCHTDAGGLEHLFKVACGLDSMVLGETEILGQLKKAYDTALQHRHTGGRLNKIFQKAFNVAKQIRTETNIQRGSVSVGSVAVELAEKIFSSLRDHSVMIIGAGETGEKTARALLSRGAHSIWFPTVPTNGPPRWPGNWAAGPSILRIGARSLPALTLSSAAPPRRTTSSPAPSWNS